MSYGVYVHVPWCRVRCPYCAFAVSPDRNAAFDAFAPAIAAEHADYRARFGFEGPAATVYLGGGTPSRLPLASLSDVLAAIERAPDAEVTVEANPEDVTAQWLEGALAAGVDRLSLGVQTLTPAFANLLNRSHTVGQARQTLARVAEAGLHSWSVDLMFALPGQTVDQLRHEVDALLALAPPHVSLYGLTYEPGTPFERARERGTFTETDDDSWRAMYDNLVDALQAAGLERYEVSNFARAGHRSRHNASYWADRPYLGLGPSAHGYAADGRRWVNRRDVDDWLAHPLDPAVEHPTPEEAAIDLLLSGMRGVEGVPLARLADHGMTLPASTLCEREGLAARTNGRLALTHAGFPVADAVVRSLVGELRSH